MLFNLTESEKTKQNKTNNKTAVSQKQLFNSTGSKASTHHYVSKKGYTYLQGRFLYRNLAVDSRTFWANSPQFLFIEGEKLSACQHTKAIDSPVVTAREQTRNKKKYTSQGRVIVWLPAMLSQIGLLKSRQNLMQQDS